MAIHKPSGLHALVREAGKGWLCVQFSMFTHPMSHGWHLMRRKDFKRMDKPRGHYNRIKDELGYTPTRHISTFWTPTPSPQWALEMLEAYRESHGKQIVETFNAASVDYAAIEKRIAASMAAKHGIVVGIDPATGPDVTIIYDEGHYIKKEDWQ